jgi:hypothetical protein
MVFRFIIIIIDFLFIHENKLDFIEICACIIFGNLTFEIMTCRTFIQSNKCYFGILVFEIMTFRKFYHSNI